MGKRGAAEFYYDAARGLYRKRVKRPDTGRWATRAKKKILSVMRRIFDAAELADLIKRSPCKGIKAGGAPTAEKVPLTRAQQTALVAAVRDTRAWPFVMLCLYAGLRREEALGLCWDCVHLDADPPYLSVRRAVVWERGRTRLTEELKSAAARRDIPMPPQLADCLSALPRTKSGPVVPDTKGRPCTQASFRSLWGAVTTRTVHDGRQVGETIRHTGVVVSLDFHCTPHQLRHTYITELILAGANVKTVQYLAGHASVQLTPEDLRAERRSVSRTLAAVLLAVVLLAVLALLAYVIVVASAPGWGIWRR